MIIIITIIIIVIIIVIMIIIIIIIMIIIKIILEVIILSKNADDVSVVPVDPKPVEAVPLPADVSQ